MVHVVFIIAKCICTHYLEGGACLCGSARESKEIYIIYIYICLYVMVMVKTVQTR